jgi:hypothetical protein
MTLKALVLKAYKGEWKDPVASQGQKTQCFQGHTVARPTGKSGMRILISWRSR